jgi:hypothetical protein
MADLSTKEGRMPDTDVRRSETGAPLGSDDRGLLLELLEQERRRLSHEVRHTDSRAFREELNHRFDRIQALIDRFRET